MHPIFEHRPKRASSPWLAHFRGPNNATLDKPATPGERGFVTAVIVAMITTTLALMFA